MPRPEFSTLPNLSTAERTFQLANPIVTRRQALELIVLGLATPALLAACNVNSESPKPKDSEGVQQLFKYLNELPDSSLKAAVIAHSSVFLPNHPKTVNFGGVDFNIYKPSVTTTQTNNANDFRGEFSHRRSGTDLGNQYTSAEDVVVMLPFPGILPQNEEQLLNETHRLPDGTFAQSFKITKGGVLADSLSPTITISSPNPDIPIDNREDLIRVGFIKEASSLFISDALISRVAGKMKEMGIVTEINAIGPDGGTSKVNLLPEGLNLITRNAGRYTAILDLGGYFIALKLLRNTPGEKVLRLDRTHDYITAFDTVDPFDPGDSDDELLQAAIDWSLNIGSDLQLDYVGNVNLLP